MQLFIFLTLLVKLVGFIILLIKILSNIEGLNHKKNRLNKELLLIYGNWKSGDNAITPDIGRFGFY